MLLCLMMLLGMLPMSALADDVLPQNVQTELEQDAGYTDGESAQNAGSVPDTSNTDEEPVQNAGSVSDTSDTDEEPAQNAGSNPEPSGIDEEPAQNTESNSDTSETDEEPAQNAGSNPEPSGINEEPTSDAGSEPEPAVDNAEVDEIVPFSNDVYKMYAGDYKPMTNITNPGDNPNGVWYDATDGKLHWTCSTTGTLQYYKSWSDTSPTTYSNFNRYYCEAYVADTESSTNITSSNQITLTNGALNVGGASPNTTYCSSNTTAPWIQVKEWLANYTSALPQGNLWIKVSACDASNQLGNSSVIFWINAGAVDQYLPKTEIYVSSTGNDTSGNGTKENPYATLIKAQAALQTAGENYVYIMDDLTVSQGLSASGCNLTVTTAPGVETATIHRDSSGSALIGSMAGAKVTLKNIILDGAEVETKNSLLLATGDGAELTLGEGAVLQNAKGTGGVGGVCVINTSATSATSPKLVIDGGVIQNCEASNEITLPSNGTSSASAVLVYNGQFEMKSGKITNNKGAVFGAVTLLGTTYQTSVMSGGEITDNISINTVGSGGGIMLTSSGQLTLTGGKITGNTGYYSDSSTLGAGGITVWKDTNDKLYLGQPETSVIIKDNQTTTATTVDGAESDAAKKNGNLCMTGSHLVVQAPPATGSAIGISAPLNTDFATATDATVAQNSVGAFFSDLGLDAEVQVNSSNTKNLQLAGVSKIYVSEISGGQGGQGGTADGSRDHPYKTLQAAYNAAPTTGVSHIYVMDDLTAAGTIQFTKSTNVVVASDPELDKTVSIKNSKDNTHLIAITGGNVTFQNIILDGQKETIIPPTVGTGISNTHALLYITGGTVTLEKGAILKNNNGGYNYNLTDGTAGAALIKGGTLNMKDKAEISECEATRFGGAVLVWGGAFNMSGGSITGNCTKSPGASGAWTEPLGGAVCIYSGTMTMTGGSITGNSITGEVNAGESLSGAGVLLRDGAFNLSGDVTITGNTNEDTGAPSNVSLNNKNNKKITIPTGKSMGENAQVGVYTVVTPTQGNDVQFTTGGSEADKTHFTSDNASAAGVVFKNNALWLSVDARSAATGSVDAATGEGFITFDGNSSFKYAVRIPGTPPTIPEGVKAYDANGDEITADDKGWFKPATTGKITFKPLPVGVEMEIVSVATNDSATTPATATNRTDAVVPAVSLDQLSAQVDKTKVNLTIDRATTGYSYALVDASNNVVKFNNEGAVDSNGSVTWTPEANGKVTFKGLEPNAKYTVVAAKTSDTMPTDDALKALAANKKIAVDVTTPSVNFKDIDPKNVSNYLSGSNDGKSTITVYPTAQGQQYAVIDKDGAFSEWQNGTGSPLTFAAETAKQSYKIVTRERENIIPGSRVPVPDATAGDTEIVITDESITDLKKSGKVYSYKLGNAAFTGKGANTLEIGVDNGYFTVDAAAPTGCNFYASLTPNGTLATTGGLQVGTAYTYLQFKCPGVNTVYLQEYLREHVTFYRASGVNQTITVVAENVDLTSGTEAFMGHYYQFVSGGSSWTTAYAGAKGKTFNGLTGYLLTVTNRNEHNYIYQKFGKNGWMAATRSVPSGSYDGAAFTCGNSLSWDWKWACGPEAGQVIGVQYANRTGMKVASYANWHSGEPNGRNIPSVSAANEGFGQYGYGGYGRWNDLPNKACSGIQGYYVEFGGYNDDNLTIKRGMDTRTVTDADCANHLTVSGDSSASLTITPTDVNFKYAVVDEDGTVVNTTDATPWTAGNGDALTFNGLTSGTLYHVVAVPKESNTTDGQGVVAGNALVDWPTLANNTATIAATAVTSVTPTDVNPVREGGSVRVPEATNNTHDYALADENGDLVTPWTQGATGGLTFNGLDSDATYTLVETGHPDTSKPYAGGAVRLYGADEGKKILPVPASEDMTGAYQSGTPDTSSITIEPAKAGLTYTATPVSPTTGNPITVIAPTDSDNRAPYVTLSGLTPGGNYTISVSDGSNTTAGPAIVAPVKSAQPERTQTGEGENKKDTVTLPGETTDTDKVYALVDPNGNYINADGSLSVDETTGQPKPVWFAGTGAAGADLTWTNLDPETTYQTLTAPKDGSNNAPVGNAVPSTVTAPASGGDVTASVAINETTGNASITVNPAESGYNYIVVDPDGKAAAIKAGNDDALTFDGLKPGQEYKVVKQPSAQTAPSVGDSVANRGTPVETPVLSEQAKTSITAAADPSAPDKLALTVNPTSAQVKYAVADPDTGAVISPWQQGTGENGAALTFPGLDPDKEYKIVVSAEETPDNNTVSDIDNRPAESVKTSGKPIAVTRAKDGDNSDKEQLTFTVDDGKSYAVVDNDGNYYNPDGSAVETGALWTPGTGSPVTVKGLDPAKTYKVLVKDSDAVNAIPTATVSKPDGEAIPADTVSAKVDSEGVASITVTPTASGKRYVVVDKDNKVVAIGTGNGGALTFSGDPIATDNIPGILPGQTYTVTMVGDDVSVNIGDHQTPSRGAQVTVPVTGDNGITIREDLENKGKYIIAVKPTNPDVDYVLVTPDGAQVTKQTGKENNGSVVFDNLEPNTTYHIVTAPKGTEYTPTEPNQPGITTPVAITVPTAAQVSKTVNTVTVNSTVPEQSYNLLDSEGNLVKDQWIPGNGGSITFDGLTTGQTYTVVVRLNDIDSSTPDNQPSDLVTGPAVTPTDSGSANDVTITPDTPVKIPDVGTIIQDDNNKVTVKPDNSNSTIIIEPNNPADKITVNGSGNSGAVTIPSGGKVVINDGNGNPMTNITIPENSAVKPSRDGKVEVPTGSRVEPTDTDSDGNPKQNFNVIEGTGVVKPDGTVTSPIDKVTKIEYDDETSTEISETEGGVVSQIEVKPATPPTTADHKALQTIAKANQGASDQSVTVKLTVEKKDEKEDIEGKDEIDAVKNQAVESLDYLDMTLIKTTTTNTGDTTTTPLPETGETLLEIKVNFNLGNKKNVTMFRYHKESGASATQILTKITDAIDKSDGCFRLDVKNNLIYIYSNKFSTYAIGYTETTSTEPGGNPGDGSGGSHGGSSGSSGGGSSNGSGAASPTVKVDNSEGGTVTLSSNTPKPGDKVTVTVKPDEGKAVSKITVTDNKGNVLEVVDNKDGAYTYIQPEKALCPVTVKVEYKTVSDAPTSNDVSKLLTTDKHIVYMNGDDNGLFRPLANMTRAEAAQVFYNLLRDKNVTAGSAFTDVPADAWYAQAVQALSGLGIINGVGDQRFAPERSITRAEFVAIASRFVDQTVSGSGGAFPDVSESYWAYGLIGQAVSYGWVNGYDDGNFYPDKQIKRSEVAKIVNVMLARSGDKSYIDTHSEQLRLFSDVKQDYWAYYDIVEASNAHEFSKSGSKESWNS